MEEDKKIHIHFHSDCPFFAGCENMLANFFNDKDFLDKYKISFSYRYTEVYDKGLRERVPDLDNIELMPLPLLDIGGLGTIKDYIKIRFLRGLVSIIFKIIGLPLRIFFIFINKKVLYRKFKNMDFDILHINNGGYPGAYSCMSAVFAARDCSKETKIVYVVNNIAYPYKTIGRFFDYFRDKRVVSAVDMFVTGSKYAGQALKNVLKLEDNKIVNIHNGINIRTPKETREDLLKRLGIEAKNRVLLGVVAVIEKRKGHIYLIKAFEKIYKETQDKEKSPFILIEGSGSEYSFLKNYVESKGLNNYIFFIGDEKNIFDFINSIDVLVLPSIEKEDFPNVILEAMSFAKPVIATKIAGIPEQIKDMETGLLVRPGNEIELADAIEIFIKDRSLVDRFGVRGQEVFNKKFIAKNAVNNYSSLYLKLIKN